MASSPITQKHLKSILDYNPETGIFIWRERTPDMFNETQKRSRDHACKNWNSKCSGKQAGWLTDRGYIVISINDVYYRSHILAHIYMTGEQPNKDIDHINGNPKDNRWINLRLATHAQNIANSKISKRNKSGYKGVYFNKNAKKYQAQIKINEDRVYLGLFDTPQEAHAAYCAAALKYFGEFARFS